MTTTAPHTAPEPRTISGMLAAVAPLVGCIAVAGPPFLIAAGALVFGALLLAGPFLLAVTLVVALALVAAVVAALIAAVAAIVAAPYALINRARHATRAMPAPRVQILPVVGRRQPIA
jgi:hypothetical protein